MVEPQICIWNAYGKIRPLNSAEDVAAIELLSDDARAALFACVAAETAKEAGEVRTFTARSRVRELDTAYDLARAVEAKTNPQATQADNVAAHAAASRADYVPAPLKNSKARKVLRAAEQALADERSELNTATRELRTLETDSGRAINAWRKFLTSPTAEEVTRNYINKSAKDRADLKAATGNADIIAPVPAQQCELERVMMARGKTQIRGRRAYLGPR